MLLVAAAFTRQTMVAAAVAIILDLFTKDKKIALRFTVTYALMGLSALALLLAVTSGLAWNHLISANVNEFGMDELWFFIVHFWNLYHWLIPICLFGLFTMRRSVVLIVYFIAALCVSTTVGKIGASLNYLIEFWVAICLLSAVGLWKLNDLSKGSWSRWISSLAWVVMLIGWQQIFHVPYHHVISESGKTTSEPLPHYKSVSALNERLPLHYLDPFGANPIEINKRLYQDYILEDQHLI